MTSRDPKGQTRDPNMLRAQHLENNRKPYFPTMHYYYTVSPKNM